MTPIDPADLRALYTATRAALAAFPGIEAARFAALLPADPGPPRLLAPVWKPGAAQLAAARPAPAFAGLLGLMRARADGLEWRQSYSAAEIGESYLKGMGYVELMGPRGHYPSDTVAFGFVAIGPDSLYPEHRHRAEEIYAILSGTGEWRYDLGPWTRHGAGEVVHSAPNRWHALRTGTEPLVMLYAWTGGDLAQKPELVPPGADMRPRRLTPDYPHWEAVLALILDAFAFMEGRIDPPSSAHRLTVAEMAAQSGSGAVWAIEEQGRPVACLFARAQGDALYLGKLAVACGHRSRGLARILIAAAEAEARARGLARLELQTRVELTENHAAFARLGFAKTGESAHPGYDRPTSITMSRTVRGDR